MIDYEGCQFKIWDKDFNVSHCTCRTMAVTETGHYLCDKHARAVSLAGFISVSYFKPSKEPEK